MGLILKNCLEGKKLYFLKLLLFFQLPSDVLLKSVCLRDEGKIFYLPEGEVGVGLGFSVCFVFSIIYAWVSFVFSDSIPCLKKNRYYFFVIKLFIKWHSHDRGIGRRSSAFYKQTKKQLEYFASSCMSCLACQNL